MASSSSLPPRTGKKQPHFLPLPSKEEITQLSKLFSPAVLATAHDFEQRLSHNIRKTSGTSILTQKPLEGFRTALEDPDFVSFFPSAASFVLGHALKIHELFPAGKVQLLENREALTLSVAQATCLLCHMFLCTLAPPDAALNLAGYNTFQLLFESEEAPEIAKLCMFLNFFQRMAAAPAGTLERGSLCFRRCVDWHPIATFEDLFNSQLPLTPLHVLRSGSIQDSRGSIQVVFANPFIGGGVLSGGATQEAIRFSSFPLGTVALLFLPAMDPHEAIRITGLEQFAVSQGYGNSFRYGGDFVDPTPRDASGSVMSCIVAIDALPISQSMRQTDPLLMLRDVNKAFCGFRVLPEETECASFQSGIATGNWGCGVYGGDPELKAILQWLAASLAGQSLRYYTFGTGNADLDKLVAALRSANATVGQLARALFEYHRSPQFAPLHPFLASEIVPLSVPQPPPPVPALAPQPPAPSDPTPPVTQPSS